MTTTDKAAADLVSLLLYLASSPTEFDEVVGVSVEYAGSPPDNVRAELERFRTKKFPNAPPIDWVALAGPAAGTPAPGVRTPGNDPISTDDVEALLDAAATPDAFDRVLIEETKVYGPAPKNVREGLDAQRAKKFPDAAPIDWSNLGGETAH